MDAVTDTIISQQSQKLFFTVKTDGDDKAGLVVRGFKAREGLSKLYTIELELASRREDIDLTRLLDKPACLRIEDRFGKPRMFHGVVERARKGKTGRPNERGLTWTMYRLTLMPAAHRLRHCKDTQIFMQKTVPEIVEQLLQEGGVRDYRFNLLEKHALREYVCQYRESKWDFVARLLAEEGIAFHFAMQDDKHVMVMTDKLTAAADCPEAKSVDYNGNPGGDVNGPWIQDFEWTEAVRASQATFSDYTFKNPFGSLMTAYRVKNNGLEADLATYDYPGGYKDYKVGEDFVRYELESLRADASAGEGAGCCQHFAPGTCFTMQGHDDKVCNRRYLLVDVLHEGSQPQALEEAAGEESGTFYRSHFAVVGDDTPWRPERKPKPRATLEVAIVTGPENEQLYTDEFGRIRVKFQWDRSNRNDDTTSCWIRVSQAWGGGSYGNVAIPRVGHEVIIGFLNEDPDQPLCLGRTYHAANHTPYQLPDHKTKMAIRSDTHKGSGYNELSFEDSNGEQNFFMHAEKDQTIKVKNNQSSRIDANAVHSIGENHALEVGSNMSQQVGGGMNQVIGGVGGAVAGLLTGGLQSLMGQSGGMLGAAMGMIAQAAQAAPSSSGGATEGAASQALPASTASAGGSEGGGGEQGGDSGGDLASHAAGFASAALGSAGGGLDAIRGAMNGASAFSLATQGGSGMASAAASLGSSLAGAVGGGVLNQLIGSMHNSTVGIAKTEQVGAVKVSNIGQMYMQKVGKEKRIRIGERLVIEVGPETDKDGNEIPPKATFIMDKDGNVLLNGINVYVVGETHVQVLSAMIDNN